MITVNQSWQRKIIPLTEGMKELLMDCHEREILKLEPYEAASIRCSKGLLMRGLLGTKVCFTLKGKRFISLYITDLGYNYLNNQL
jgi:hypothetical protein